MVQGFGLELKPFLQFQFSSNSASSGLILQFEPNRGQVYIEP